MVNNLINTVDSMFYYFIFTHTNLIGVDQLKPKNGTMIIIWPWMILCHMIINALMFFIALDSCNQCNYRVKRKNMSHSLSLTLSYLWGLLRWLQEQREVWTTTWHFSNTFYASIFLQWNRSHRQIDEGLLNDKTIIAISLSH